MKRRAGRFLMVAAMVGGTCGRAMANEWYIHNVNDAGRVFCKLETDGGPLGLALYERSHGNTTQIGFVNQGMYKAGINVRIYSAYLGTWAHETFYLSMKFCQAAIPEREAELREEQDQLDSH
jgi:hypothetical protein